MAAPRLKNPDKIPFGKFMAWNSSGASLAVQYILLTYLQIYCTNALGLNAAIVGTLLMASKLIDGVTDIVAGYLIDNTNTKLGRGRPYGLAILGVWVCTWLLFSTPQGLGATAKYAWVVVFYILAQAVFATLLNASQTVYMVRAFHNDQKYVTLTSIGGLVTTFVVIVFNVIWPNLEEPIVDSAPGWSRVVLILAIIFGVIGIMRFLFVKEEAVLDADSEKIKLRDILELLKHNKYVYCIALMLLLSNLVAGMGVSSYYYLYIVGDISIQGVMSLFTVLAMLTMMFYPKLLKKVSPRKLVVIGCTAAAVGGIINFFARDNLALLAIGSIVSGIGFLPISYLLGLFIIECADFNEWKGRPRMEGSISSVTSLATKIGTALGSFFLGIMMNASHFDGMAQVQTGSALTMIRFLFGLANTVFYVLIIIVLQFYKLDRLKPQISEELSARHAAAKDS